MYLWAIAATVKVTTAFQAYVGGIFDEFTPVSSDKDVNHGIIIVGWDDSKHAYRIKIHGDSAGVKRVICGLNMGCNNVGYGAAWVVLDKDNFIFGGDCNDCYYKEIRISICYCIVNGCGCTKI
jgi:hypothetical protein